MRRIFVVIDHLRDGTREIGKTASRPRSASRQDFPFDADLPGFGGSTGLIVVLSFEAVFSEGAWRVEKSLKDIVISMFQLVKVD